MYKLVIIDDEYYTLMGMKEIIPWQNYGIEVAGTASDGNEGIEVINETGADIVIADIRMNEMDGLEMIRRLRDDGYSGRIIILSGYLEFEYAQTAIELKVERYMTKPVNAHELEKVIIKIKEELDAEKGSIPLPPLPDLLKEVLQEIDEIYMKDVRLSALADKYYCSPAYLSKLFKRYVGMNYKDYVAKIRVKKAKELLKGTNMLIDEIMYAVGYQDSQHFRQIFKKIEGVSPSEFRKS